MAKKKEPKIDKSTINKAVDYGVLQTNAKLFHTLMDQVNKDHVATINVATAAEEFACIYGANKNLYRILPSLQDGLRPGKRRMLYAFWELNKRPQNTKPDTLAKLKQNKNKLSRVVGDTIGKYHPHGDTSVAETICGEGQVFRNNICTVGAQGAYGNINGEQHAADRYLEAYLPEYTIDCFFDDFDSYCVPMRESYDGKGMEPEYLPAKYPHVLFNPQFSGIGIGLASNIPPFNIQEVLEATIKLIKNPDAKIMLIPDFTFGVDIVDTGQFKEINKNGKGSLTVQGRYIVDAVHNTIEVVSLPLNVYSKNWIKNLAMHCKKGGEMEGKIIDIANHTSETQVDIILTLNPETNTDDVVKWLTTKSGMRYPHAVSIHVVDNYVPYVLGVKSLLKEWISFRKDCLRSMYNFKLVRMMEKEHETDVLIMLCSSKENAEEAMRIARTSINKEDTIKALMKRYEITSLQADTIANMRLSQFNKDKTVEYKEIKKECKKQIKEITEILTNDEKLDDVIIDQLEEGIRKYGTPRKSRVIRLDEELDIPDTLHLVGISKSGFIKKIKYKAGMPIGVVGKDNRNVMIFKAGNRDSIYVISSDGIISQIPLSSIPDMKVDDIGVEIKRYFGGSGEIITTLKAPSKKEAMTMAEMELMTVTKNGYAKRLKLSDLKLKDGKEQRIINLNEGDELAKVIVIPNNTLDLVVCTNLGNGLRLPIDSIKPASKTAKGQRIINMATEEDVTDLNVIDPSIKHLLYITSSGKMKLTELKYFPRAEKGSKSISLISLDTTEQLIGVISAKKNDQIKLYGKKGGDIYDPVGVNEIPIRSRVSKGERIVKTLRSDVIVGFKLFQA